MSGMVTAMDEAVRKVMIAMRKYKLTNNLLVVFTSDVSTIYYIFLTSGHSKFNSGKKKDGI